MAVLNPTVATLGLSPFQIELYGSKHRPKPNSLIEKIKCQSLVSMNCSFLLLHGAYGTASKEEAAFVRIILIDNGILKLIARRS